MPTRARGNYDECPYHYFVSGNTMSYAGTPQNATDKNVTYVLQKQR